MKFLDERIEISVDWGSSSGLPAAGMYTYTLWVLDNDDPYGEYEIFIGNFYYNRTRYVTLDVTDILRSLGARLYYIKKDLTTPYTVITSESDGIVLRYYISINYNGTTKSSPLITVAHIYRYPNGSEYLNTLAGQQIFEPATQTTSIIPLLQGYKYNTGNERNCFDLIPHYPLKNTQNFAFAAAFEFGTSVQQIKLYITDTAEVDLYQTVGITQGCTHTVTYIASIAEFLEDYFYERQEEGWYGDIQIDVDMTRYPTIAIFDECFSRFYLQWRDRFGSWQCQPLYEVETYSEDIETQEYKTYTDKRTVYNKQIKPKWKLNTGWIENRYVPYYESIFVSPFLVLYDSKQDKCYEVIIKDDYTEKNYKNQKKLVNFELQLEGAESQNIIY